MKGQSYNMTVSVIFCLIPALTEVVARHLKWVLIFYKWENRIKTGKRIEPGIPNYALGAQDTTANSRTSRGIG